MTLSSGRTCAVLAFVLMVIAIAPVGIAAQDPPPASAGGGRVRDPPLPANAEPDHAPAASLSILAYGGAGAGIGGLAGIAGVTGTLDRWLLGVKYAKTMWREAWRSRGGGAELETYSEHVALLFGRTFGENGRRSIAVGAGGSKQWEVPYIPCGLDCWLGEWETGSTLVTTRGTTLALAAETHTAPLAGLLALGLELNAFFGSGATTANLDVVLHLGRLR